MVVQPSAQGGVDDAAALVGAVSSVVCDGSEAANEAEVKDDGQGGEHGHTANAECQEDAEEGVQDCGAGHTLYSLLPCWDMGVVISQDGEEVAVDSEDDGCAGEFEESEACLAEAEDDAAESHDIGRSVDR